MADGIPCGNCGHQEGSHDLLAKAREDDEEQEFLDDMFDDAREVMDSYSESLASCRGYSPEDPRLAERLAQARAIERGFPTDDMGC